MTTLKFKKIFLPMIFSSVLLTSCENTDLEPTETLESNLNQIVTSYESSLDVTNDFTLKGLSLPSKEKDEISPSTQQETKVNEEIICYLKAKIDSDRENEYSKTTRVVYPTNEYWVGVFKTSTCGGNPEFIYSMDCEDGGWSSINNPKNRPFATFADGNKNIEFHMCVVKGANFGGYALALGYVPSDVFSASNIVERYHDNEDNGNKNAVLSDVKPDINGKIGPSIFTQNTLFYWIKDNSSRINSFSNSYGVIAYNGDIEINIDDENGKNSNWARYKKVIDPYTTQWIDFPYKEWTEGFSLWENTGYKVLIK